MIQNILKIGLTLGVVAAMISCSSGNKEKSNVLVSYEKSFHIDKKYLLIPMEDQGPESVVCLKQGDTLLDVPFTVRIAQSKIDYWMPIDVEKYKGEEISVLFESIEKNHIGYSQIKQADEFHFNYNEKYRPDYHFSPPYGWMNDPNGMVYLDGEYHLYYQHNPYGTMWGNMNWGHAVSRDLVRWEHLPVVISPDSLGAIFSGSAVVDKNNAAGFGAGALVSLYTSAGKVQTQSMGYSFDHGRTFMKYEQNPVLKDQNYPDFRDPKVFWHAASKRWVMSLATGRTITFYGSADLKEWTRLSEFGEGIGAHGGVWECPDLFPLSYNGQTKWVLLVSINPGGPNGGSATQYFIGHFDGQNFQPDHLPYPLWLDYGRDNYAGVTWSNVPDNQSVFIGWMSNWDYANQVPCENFRNAMTIPRELKLVGKGKHLFVASEPIKKLKELRVEEKALNAISVNGEYILNKLFETANDSYELEMNLFPGKSSGFSFKLQNRKGEELSFSFDMNKEILHIDRSGSGMVDFNERFAPESIQVPVSRVDRYNIRLFIDKASSELFINHGEIVSTNLIFPSEPYNSLQFKSENGLLTVEELKIYNLK